MGLITLRRLKVHLMSGLVSRFPDSLLKFQFLPDLTLEEEQEQELELSIGQFG